MKNKICGKQKTHFFCDLDHTLIYSHRVPIHNDKRVVEELHGESQSFMTEKTYEFFLTQEIVQLVPVTTRSREQYERISVLQKDFPSQYALICNGGVLLINGCEDRTWNTETLSIISHELSDLEYAKKVVERLIPRTQIHDVNMMFFYAKHDTPDVFAARLKQELSSSSIQVLHDNRKVYCLPRELHKGNAIERFKKRFSVTKSIGAGDSIFDVPMLNAVDTALFPTGIDHLIKTKEKIRISDQVFSDGICSYLETLKR